MWLESGLFMSSENKWPFSGTVEDALGFCVRFRVQDGEAMLILYSLSGGKG